MLRRLPCLSARSLGESVHGQVVEASGRPDTVVAEFRSLLALDAAIGNLEARVLGQYYLSLYSRRLREVLALFDLRPAGTAAADYDRWDRAQWADSVALIAREAGEVSSALARVSGVASEQTTKLKQFLGRIGTELRGCAPDSQR